jgi:hypothetical protein
MNLDAAIADSSYPKILGQNLKILRDVYSAAADTFILNHHSHHHFWAAIQFATYVRRPIEMYREVIQIRNMIRNRMMLLNIHLVL